MGYVADDVLGEFEAIDGWIGVFFVLVLSGGTGLVGTNFGGVAWLESVICSVREPLVEEDVGYLVHLTVRTCVKGDLKCIR